MLKTGSTFSGLKNRDVESMEIHENTFCVLDVWVSETDKKKIERKKMFDIE